MSLFRRSQLKMVNLSGLLASATSVTRIKTHHIRRLGPLRPLTEPLFTRWVRTAISFVSKLRMARFDGKKVFERTSAANLANGHMQSHHRSLLTTRRYH